MFFPQTALNRMQAAFRSASSSFVRLNFRTMSAVFILTVRGGKVRAGRLIFSLRTAAVHSDNRAEGGLQGDGLPRVSQNFMGDFMGEEGGLELGDEGHEAFGQIEDPPPARVGVDYRGVDNPEFPFLAVFRPGRDPDDEKDLSHALDLCRLQSGPSDAECGGTQPGRGGRRAKSAMAIAFMPAPTRLPRARV